MELKEYKEFNESLTTFKLHDRLKVIVVHKPGFSKTYATITAPIGSIHQGYYEDGTLMKAPSGVAHFLEHKIFDDNGDDISRQFSLDEAQVNAYTAHNRTTYLFSATNHVLNNIKRLVNMFFNPKFTKEGVTKEKNIIVEELNMHIDDPYYYQYMTLLNQLFHQHPIKEDILGTEASINAMDERVLKVMHKAYYKPEITNLVVVGDIDAKTLKTFLETEITLPESNLLEPLNDNFDEPNTVLTTTSEKAVDIFVPSVLLGIKLMPDFNQPIEKKIHTQLAVSMMLNLLFGKSGDIYEALLEAGLINDTYGLDVQLESAYGYILIGSETMKPNALLETLEAVLTSLPDKAISTEDFERLKRQMLGDFIMSLDSLEYLAQENSRYAHDDITFYDVLTIAKKITYEDILEARSSFNDNQISSVVLTSKHKNNVEE